MKVVLLVNFVGCSTLIGQRPMKSLLSICPSVCPSVCPSLSFLKIGSLVFSNSVHDDSWPNGPKSGLKLGFFHFLKFGSLVFLEIAYNDSVQQSVTSSRGKIHEKSFWGPKFVPKGPKSGLKLGFLSFSQVWFLGFLEIAYNDSVQQCVTSRRGKIREKVFWGPDLCQRG